MKNKLFMLLCGLLVCFISACSDDEQEQQAPPKETPEVIKEVVETLKDVYKRQILCINIIFAKI